MKHTNLFYFVPYNLQFNGKSTETRNFAKKEKMFEIDYKVKKTIKKKIEIICYVIQETHITRGNDDDEQRAKIYFSKQIRRWAEYLFEEMSNIT